MALLRGLQRGLVRGLKRGLGVSLGGRGIIVAAIHSENADATDLQNYTFTQTQALAPDTFHLLVVGTTHATAAEVPSSITGFGLTWTAVSGGTGTFSSGARRMSLYYAFGPITSTTSLVINHATVHTACWYAVVRLSGARLKAPRQAATNTVVGTTITGTLSALEYSGNAVVYGLGRVISEGSNPPASGGWVELSDRASPGSPAGQVETAWAKGDPTADPTWTTSGGSCIVLCEMEAS